MAGRRVTTTLAATVIDSCLLELRILYFRGCAGSEHHFGISRWLLQHRFRYVLQRANRRGDGCSGSVFASQWDCRFHIGGRRQHRFEEPRLRKPAWLRPD